MRKDQSETRGTLSPRNYSVRAPLTPTIPQDAHIEGLSVPHKTPKLAFLEKLSVTKYLPPSPHPLHFLKQQPPSPQTGCRWPGSYGNPVPASSGVDPLKRPEWW